MLRILKSLSLSEALLFVVLFAVLVQTHSARAEAPPTAKSFVTMQPNPPLSFKWSMPKRFGPRKPDGMVDYHWNPETRSYSTDYVRPESWKVDFDACTPPATPGSTFAWEIDGVVIQNPNPSSCTFSHAFAAQRTYAVKLTMAAPDGAISVTSSPVTVKDLLIVSLGDSFASGQGNPDIPKKGSSPAKWIEKICARSEFAGPAQAALSIEQADPHTSVTFVSFACTGAEISAGIIGEQTINNVKLDPQIAKLRDALNGRKIDALLISVGGNDMGFADLVAGCILKSDCFKKADILNEFQTGLDSLAPRYQLLSDAILRLQPDTKVFVTEYPDLVRDENGELCHHKPNSDWFSLINRDEAKWASEVVVPSLNRKVAEAAQKHDWVYVSGVYDTFRNHGYCANDSLRWVRTFKDAKRIQGTDQDCGDLISFVPALMSKSKLKRCVISSGSAHPTSGGHAVYATRLIKALQDNGVTTPPAL